MVGNVAPSVIHLDKSSYALGIFVALGMARDTRDGEFAILRAEVDTLSRANIVRTTEPYDIFTRITTLIGLAMRIPVVCALTFPLVLITFVLGIILSVPLLGLVLLSLANVIWLSMLGLLMGSSWLWIKVPILRLLLLLPGIAIANMAYLFVILIPDMGEKYQKATKLAICETWPKSYTFLVASKTMDNDS